VIMGKKIVMIAFSFCLFGADCEENPEAGEPTPVDRTHIAPFGAEESCLEDGTCEAWASSPWMDEISDIELEGYIEIEPATRIRLFHNLGRKPREVNAYVGFSEASDALMPASGNAAEIMEVTDEYIIVRNGSGGSFYYRFVLR